MPSRKALREKTKKKQEISKKAMTKLIIMFVSVAIMFFCIMQVYYLGRYTLGLEVSSKHLRIYKWVGLLVSGDNANE